MLSGLSLAGSSMIIYGYLDGTLDIWDYVDYWSLILARSCVIAAKYGFYHPAHQYITANVELPTYIFERELVAVQELGHSVDNVLEEMVLHLASVSMHAKQTIELLTTRKFVIGDIREEDAVWERLRDTTHEALKRRYEKKEGLEELDEV